MRIENVKVCTSTDEQGGATPKRLQFSVKTQSEQNREKEVYIRTKSMMAKIGLCAAAVVLALILRLTGLEKPVVEASAQEGENESETGDTLGALHFVDAPKVSTIRRQKWAAPVITNDIELLRDSQMVRFSAEVSKVSNCCKGEVSAIGEDARYGDYVRFKHDDGLETIYFGLEEISVSKGQSVALGETIGTVPIGRSIYLCILQDGAPQNPIDYVSINIGG